MPVIDGEKWACSSCIKGHRVSGCNHNERELHHINPKGRPVKQCEHCRGARKSKSHHAKCDCGDKKDKDKLKDKGDTKAHDSPCHSCQCHSGGKCICGTIKSETLDLKLDTARQSLHEARAKPKLTTTHSESQLTVFANGHHKPCHRNNNTAHVSGAPYKIPRPHTLHGHSSFAALTQSNHSYSKPDVPATRSMDTLSLSNNDFYAMFGSTQRSVDGLPMTTMAASVDTVGFQDSLFTNQSGAFPQESNSPSSNPSETFSSQQWPWATAATPVNGSFAFGSLSTSPSQDCLPNFDNEWSMPSAGFNPLWSAGDLPLDPSKLDDSLTQPMSHSGESKQSGPGLTVASSVHSEIEGPTLYGDMEFTSPPSTASESLFWEDQPVYRLATSGLNQNLAAPVSMPAMTSVPNTQGFEPDLMKSLNTAPTTMHSAFSNDFAETAAIAIPNTIDDISIEPWPIEQSTGSFNAFNAFDLTYPNNWL
ncbi:hypothetical protein P153DRAFT_366032 [Dothidotthia symphoricarpi CBS 119687]|uniref:Copper-fist domain-containing protein n=1 Tax=Dothidotthia symphoricarpi CBS 119687 TaxID=1392245 RepID=A0A6A6AH71_9PLEO|nr:uncharacterized protein P153DRAFT_366032 [Dothidotthia symphoricarpi CBS 119687]KAF2130445.1 hypothetical protein P153DRAFT_366032 [Dothidotthia symphoricarpi CBS 119687]